VQESPGFGRRRITRWPLSIGEGTEPPNPDGFECDDADTVLEGGHFRLYPALSGLIQWDPALSTLILVRARDKGVVLRQSARYPGAPILWFYI
jgi:hypothetical protein